MTERDSLPPRQEIIVTLVHGTILFARWPFVFRLLRRIGAALSRGDAKPQWYQRGSAFAVALRESLGEDCRDIQPFEWSGGNTVWDRLSGAGALGQADAGQAPAARAGARLTLRQHITKIRDDYPDAAQVLIGHSHGGSVCLAALADPETRKMVKAFVSLATPYVHVRKRFDSQSVEAALKILGFLSFTAVMLASMWWLESLVGEVLNAAVFTLAMFAVMAVGVAVWNRRRARIAAVREWASSLSEVEDAGPARLIVISDGDEALLALKVAEGLSSMLRGLWRAASRLVELAEEAWGASRWLAWVIYAGLAVGSVVFFLKFDSQSPWGPNDAPFDLWFLVKVALIAIFGPVFVFFAVALALFVPTLAAMLVGFPPLIFFRWLAFGWGGAPGMDVTAESLPLGAVTAVRLPAPIGRRGLRHSELYNDARVPPLIATFLKKGPAGLV